MPRFRPPPSPCGLRSRRESGVVRHARSLTLARCSTPVCGDVTALCADTHSETRMTLALAPVQGEGAMLTVKLF